MVLKCRCREGFPFFPGQSIYAGLQQMRRLRPGYVVALPPLIAAASRQKRKAPDGACLRLEIRKQNQAAVGIVKHV